MRLIPCNSQQLVTIFKERYAKYLSQHDINRHYIIRYNDDGTFTSSTFENHIQLGEGHGRYTIVERIKGGPLINIQYKTIFPSPNISSPMNPNNSFYPHLHNYTIGPFYTRIPDEPVTWLPVLYNHLQMEKGFKVLNFYKYDYTDINHI